MTNKHTPGPWRSDVQGSDGDQVFSANGMIVADCKWTAEVFDKRVANAALIASAPDLLVERDSLREVNAELVAALKRIIAFDSMDYGLHIRGMQGIARSAIAKAEEVAK